MNEWGNNPATYEAIAAIISSIGIFAVFISTILAWHSFRETRAQRRAMENEMAARMRPWVGLFDCKFNINSENEADFDIDELHLLLRNFGTLPAQNAFLRTTIIPLKVGEYESKNPINAEEKGAKVLLPLEEGNYKINLSNYPQFATWKKERRDLRVDGDFSYCLSKLEFHCRFECVLRFGVPNTEYKHFKVTWRNQEVS
jgi:hypothetical protein